MTQIQINSLTEKELTTENSIILAALHELENRLIEKLRIVHAEIERLEIK